jgi:hypothetical protein
MTDTPNPDSEPYVRPFTDFLREQSRGESLTELSDGLRDLVARVRATGKPGAITYVVKVEPVKNTDDAYAVTDEIRLKLPEFPRQGSLMFTDHDGNLIGSDPNQLIALNVDPATGEITTPGSP